jgi:hypothetical protein
VSINNEVGFIPSGGTSQKVVYKLLSKTYKYTDFTAAATSDTEAFVTLPTGPVWFLENWVDLDEAFAGAGPVSNATLSLGDAGAATELINAAVVFSGLGAKTTRGARAYGYVEDGHVPIVTLTLTGGNCSGLTAGQVTVNQLIAYIEER